MLIELDLNNNAVEALEAVAAAIEDAMTSTLGSHDSLGRIDPQLLNAAVGLLGDEALAICWMSRPLRALGHKQPIDVSIEEARDMIGWLEHGFGA